MADKDNELEIMEMLDKASRGEKLGNENMKSVFEKTKSRSRLTTSKKALLVTVTVVAGLAILPIPIIMYNKNKGKNIAGQVSLDFNINEAEDVEIKFKKGDTIGSLQATDIPGYRFDGWYGDEDFTNKLSNEMQIADDDDLQIFGRYIEVHQFTMYFMDALNNVKVKRIMVDDGTSVQDAIELLNIPSNYINNGHFVDSSYSGNANIYALIEDDVEIFSKYVKEINVSIVINGKTEFEGTLREDGEETLEQQISEYSAPKEGYVFKGWYSAQNYNNNSKIDISNLTESSYILYGKYVKEVIVTVNIDGIETIINSNVEDINTEFKALCQEQNVTDYNTCGWFEDASLTTVSDINENTNSHIFSNGDTLYTYRATPDKVKYGFYSSGKYSVAPIDKNISGKVVLPRIPKQNYVIAELRGFENCSKITEVILPQNDIKVNSFSGCISLRKINITSGCTVVNDAFYNLSNLTNVTLGDGVSIEDNVFIGTGITSIDIPSNCTIGASAFRGLSNLTMIKLGSDVSIGEGAFVGTGITSIDIPSSCTIGGYAFDGLSNLTMIKLGSGVSIGYGAFEGTGVETIKIPERCTILSKAFYNCASLQSATISTGVFYIRSEVFAECRNLETVTIETFGNVGVFETIEQKAFYNCTSLRSVDFSSCVDGKYYYGREHTVKGLLEISESVFEGCVSLESISLPYTITRIKKNAFKDCVKLEEINIEARVDGDETVINLKTIEIGAFAGCKLLTELDLSICTKLTTIGAGAFIGCTALTSVVLPDGEWYATTNSNYKNGALVDMDSVDIVTLLKDETLYWYR